MTQRASIRYEVHQLKLIVLQYERRGFIHRVDFGLQESRYRFDAVFESPEDGHLVFVELLSKRRRADVNESRVAALEQAARAFPDAEVDFRYVDSDVEPYAEFSSARSLPVANRNLAGVLKQRLPNSKGVASSNLDLLGLWYLHALTLREFASFLNESDARSDNVLDIYNRLLSREILSAPEQIEDGVDLDLFQIHEAVLAAVQGAIIEKRYPNELRAHVKCVRRQVSKLTKSKKKSQTIG